MAKFGVEYEFTGKNPKTGAEQVKIVSFELSAAGVWYCKKVSIPIKPLAGTQGKNKIADKTGVPYKRKDGNFSNSKRAGHERNWAAGRQYSRGRILRLRTGKYGTPPAKAGTAWEPKTFNLRCPRWLNNGVVLDAVRSIFKAKIEFKETPTTVEQLYPQVEIDGVLYRIRDIDYVLSGDVSTGISNAAATQEQLTEPTLLPNQSSGPGAP